MAGPVFKFWMTRFTNAWYGLTEDERNAHLAKAREALAQVGGKSVITSMTGWSSEQWAFCGVEEFPDVAAVQEHTQLLYDLGHFRYFNGSSILGSKYSPE